MNIFQKWRSKRRQRKIEAAIKNYNAAMIELAEAAEIIGEIARESGVKSETLEAAIKEMAETAKTAAITAEDFQKGGQQYGKR